jgi:hypothetical protein
MDAPSASHSLGALTLRLVDGDPRRIAFRGIEVLRRLSYPVRDENWGTIPVETVSESAECRDGLLDVRRRFADRDGRFSGTFSLTGEESGDKARLIARLELVPRRVFMTNRAGFTLLHPIAGVAGRTLTVTHSGGSVETGAFPERISPAQPAFDIAALAYDVEGVAVDIRFDGEVFEMEDQRNWSDASFKTYCRPLSAPWPYALRPDVPVVQTVTISFAHVADSAPKAMPRRSALLPQLALAAEPGLTTRHDVPGPVLPLRLRLRTDAAGQVLAPGFRSGPLTLELVLPQGADPAPALLGVARTVEAAGVQPERVIVLPEVYLKSHQPDGPWPEGPTPADLVDPARAAFPQAAIGGGSLTHFTEFNRCPPPTGIAFATFGNAAIVHAADDLSVIETLEALPAIFDSARALVPATPLHLGLFSIGMRSNPYGADVIANPLGQCLPMVRNDPRQTRCFAAAYAVGVLAAAAEHGVESLALAMTDGPLGCIDDDGPLPIYHVIRVASGWAGQPATITQSPDGLVTVYTGRGALVAHLGDSPVTMTPTGQWRQLSSGTVAAARDPLWTERMPTATGPATLAPGDVLILEGCV